MLRGLGSARADPVTRGPASFSRERGAEGRHALPPTGRGVTKEDLGLPRGGREVRKGDRCLLCGGSGATKEELGLPCGGSGVKQGDRSLLRGGGGVKKGGMVLPRGGSGVKREALGLPVPSQPPRGRRCGRVPIHRRVPPVASSPCRRLPVPGSSPCRLPRCRPAPSAEPSATSPEPRKNKSKMPPRSIFTPARGMRCAPLPSLVRGGDEQSLCKRRLWRHREGFRPEPTS